jgi:hypothetical protein
MTSIDAAVADGATNATSAQWRRSSLCANSGCVEVAITPAQVMVRHSDQPNGPVIAYDHDEWRAFVGGVRAGDFSV